MWNPIRNNRLKSYTKSIERMKASKKLTTSDYSSIIKVNDFINDHIKYKFEAEGDRWQTQEETLHLGTGDCEDLAIAKYTMALESGCCNRPDDMYLVYGYQNEVGHMVLLWGDFILDNLHDDPVFKSNIDDRFIPIYGFNLNHVILVSDDWKVSRIAEKLEMTSWDRVVNRSNKLKDYFILDHEIKSGASV